MKELAVLLSFEERIQIVKTELFLVEHVGLLFQALLFRSLVIGRNVIE